MGTENMALVPHIMSNNLGKKPTLKGKGIVTPSHFCPDLFSREENVKAVDSALLVICQFCAFLSSIYTLRKYIPFA